ncbi:glycosyltransferase family 4 protein [Roseovarius rhodophyticola]|uniref:Glycosyltransferase family 4 protein n=1 Tax=Roseovarius rhodophyticola TaxID=3080827 RepID=A0ABZ2TG58_9RHOB|nr:glycosyltransferase family 4 protein [Roseovarius sp. W115]MDV2928939.1 glycosyltransferase family 4 protein [Roseovarius sp. W115]
MTGKDFHLDLPTCRRGAFAVPGDINTQTGGYRYDRKLVDGLRALGWDITLLQLGTSFPNPTSQDMRDAEKQLAALPEDCPVIIDGLALGAFDPAVLDAVNASIVALIHHPLARENGHSAEQRAHFLTSERQNLARAVHVLVPSPHTAKVLHADYDVSTSRITIARPGTDRPLSTGVKTDPPLILSVGIQVSRKGHDVLLKALARLTAHTWTAIIAGGAFDPDHAAELARLVNELGLSDRVKIVGAVSDETLSHLYGQASLFALATRYEGYGIVFDEAMVHGLPIVTCRVGAVPDTVAPDAGRLVPPDDPLAFAAALEDLLDNAHERREMASASARAGAALPTWDDTVKIVDETLLRVASTQVTKV